MLVIPPRTAPARCLWIALAWLVTASSPSPALAAPEKPADDGPPTYRGEVTKDSAPADGLFDLRFHLYSGPEPDPQQPLETLEIFGVEVVDGRFQVELDFDLRPDEPFLGLEIAEANTGSFTRLLPLQPLGPSLEARPAISASTEGAPEPYEVSALSAGDLHVSGKVVAGGVELDGQLVTSWNEVGGGGVKIRHRSRTTTDGALPEMTLQSGGGWVTGGAKSITVDRAGYILVLLTGVAYQPFPSGDYHAGVKVGIGTSAGGAPSNQYTAVALGGGQNSITSFVTQYMYPVSSSGTYTFYVIARWGHGWSPAALRPEAMTLLFIPS